MALAGRASLLSLRKFADLSSRKLLAIRHHKLPQSHAPGGQSSRLTDMFHVCSRQQHRFFRSSRVEKSGFGSTVTKVGGSAPRSGNLLKPFLFTVSVCGASYAGCAIWQYENFRNRLSSKMESHYDTFYGKAGGIRQHLNGIWNSLTDAQKMMAGVIGLNFAIFFAWKMAPARIMVKYFASSPTSGAPSLSLLLSAFSHHSLIHIGLNMYILWSFINPTAALFGKEQLLATYISAGVVSGFTSHVFKVLRKSHTPSLGASGAILALFGAICTHYPNSKFSIVLVSAIYPHQITADSCMKAMICVDVLGCLFGWKFLDHAAHLGGMLFGIMYTKYGHTLVWGNREPLVNWWHKKRGPPKP